MRALKLACSTCRSHHTSVAARHNHDELPSSKSMRISQWWIRLLPCRTMSCCSERGAPKLTCAAITIGSVVMRTCTLILHGRLSVQLKREVEQLLCSLPYLPISDAARGGKIPHGDPHYARSSNGSPATWSRCSTVLWLAGLVGVETCPELPHP